jgi:hypothetical protein
MTAPTETHTDASDAPIPDHLLAAAFNQRSSPFGDDEPESPDPTAETPPVSATDLEETPAAPDSATPPDPTDAETPPSEVPEEASDTPAVAEDVFATAPTSGTPLTYTVDGVQKQYPGIFEVAGKGAVIPSDALPRVRDTIQRAEHAVEQNRRMYAEQQEFQRVGGFERVEQVERDFARQNAAGEVLVALFQSPDELASLLVRKADGTIGFSERHSVVLDKMQVAAGKAEMQARTEWSTKRTTVREEVNAPSERESALTEAIALMGKDLGEEDREAAMAFFGPFAESLVRKATPEDVAKYPQFRVGQTLVDAPKMAAWFTDRQAHRQAVSKESEARKKAEAENQKRQAQARAATPPAKPKAKVQPRNTDGTFTEGRQEGKPKYDREDFLEAAMKGLPTPGTTDD